MATRSWGRPRRLKPGNANLPIGESQSANREIGVPGKHREACGLVVAACVVACRGWGVSRLGDRKRRGIAQISREHQHQRGDDAEREKCVQRRQDAAQVGRRTARKPPGDRAGCKPAKSRNGARPGSDLEARPALRTDDVVGVRRCIRRGNFCLAMRTDANSHGSPPNANAYNNRTGGPMKRGDKRREQNAAALEESPRVGRFVSEEGVEVEELLFTLATKPLHPFFHRTPRGIE